MRVEFKGELRRVESNEFTKKDGSKGIGYKMLVEFGADSLQFPTVREVWEQFEMGYLEKGMDCQFVADYNPRFQFNNFVVEEAVSCQWVKGVALYSVNALDYIKTQSAAEVNF